VLPKANQQLGVEDGGSGCAAHGGVRKQDELSSPEGCRGASVQLLRHAVAAVAVEAGLGRSGCEVHAPAQRERWQIAAGQAAETQAHAARISRQPWLWWRIWGEALGVTFDYGNHCGGAVHARRPNGGNRVPSRWRAA